MAGLQTHETLHRDIDNEIKRLGRTNIIVVGRTGVGKSTLINAIFNKDVAQTGTGSSVTKNIQKYPIPGTLLTLFDSRGLEMKEYKKIMDEVCQFIKQCQKKKDINEHIHIAWMCISHMSHRLEEGEIAFVNMISKYTPVIIVITQSYDEDETLFNEVQNKFQDSKVISVVAKEKVMRAGYPPISPVGLPNLVKMTDELLPAAQQIAFLAAQNVDFNAKLIKAQAIVVTAAAAAVTAAAVPIPFSDMALLVPIETGMIISITAVFGFEIERSVVMALLGIFTTAAGASIIGLGLATLLKFIPGVGSIAGGIIDASIAASVTTAFGEAYIGILVLLFKENNGVQPTTDQLVAKCKQEWEKKDDSKPNSTKN
ncbi:hypothetical protein I4U23_011577 [Adineta vaga]|nr:hypothetical protein I4U23_011577 [Adineta vaga]